MSNGPASLGLIKWSTWLASMGVNKTTGWKWRKEGKIAEPVNINGILYVTAKAREEFQRRAEAGEFAKEPKQPRR